MRHGPSRNESVPVENAHHLEADSPSRLAGKPRGSTGRRCVDDGLGPPRGRGCPCVRPVGRLAVDIRGPPRPNLAGWLALAGGLSVLACIRKVRIAPMTNRKMLKPIPTVTPPRTLRVCRQGCYRQVMPSSEGTPPAVRPLRPWLRPGVPPSGTRRARALPPRPGHQVQGIALVAEQD